MEGVGLGNQIHPQSVLGRFSSMVTDPRSRRERVYPLPAILAILFLGALEGEGSLRGMYLRGRRYWGEVTKRLGSTGVAKVPGLTTVWYVLQRVSAGELQKALSGQVEGAEALSIDGKSLRGSRRAGERAVQVLAMVGQLSGQVLAQRLVEGDEKATAVALLAEAPIEGRVISLDAGLMERRVVDTIEGKGGTT